MAPSKVSPQQDELMKAVLANDEAGLAALVGLNVSVTFVSELGLSPAIVAAENGFTGCLKVLLKAGADPNKVALVLVWHAGQRSHSSSGVPDAARPSQPPCAGAGQRKLPATGSNHVGRRGVLPTAAGARGVSQPLQVAE